MNDRAPIRDRTLILRILVPGLEARLRDKMKELEDQQQQQQTQQPPSRGGGGNLGPNDGNHASSSNSNNNNVGSGGTSAKESYLDLDGVTCEPTPARNRTLWNFHCDGATYPARLVNLPCPIELHKTHDHAMYYKCVDVCQMLIVYEDDMALEEAEFVPAEGFPSYYHSGITPPLRKVVERRFAAREHRAMAPPRAAIVDVEAELTDLMENLAKDEKNKRKNKVPTLSSATKVLVRWHVWMRRSSKE
jgi:transcription initiation factor TFIID subunit 7